MTHVVVVADRVAPAGLADLRETAELEVVDVAGDAAALNAALPRAHALLVRSETKVTEAMLEKAPELKVIGRAGIGVDNIDVPAATHRGIAVLNAPGANTVSAAEHTFALLLALLRHVADAAGTMRAGKWDRKAFEGRELRGKTLGVVGLGRIGAHVTKIARAFGMRVVAHDPFLPEARAAELGVDLLPLDDMLRVADVVTLHLPLTDETRALLDTRRLRLLPKGAVLVNAARGGLVDEGALVDALTDGTLAGAALDVYSKEPLPADHPLRRAPHVVLTPHLAASTAEAQARVSKEICAAVREALLTGDVGGAVNVPGLPAAGMAALRPVLELARRMGRLAAAIARGRVRAIGLELGAGSGTAAESVGLAAVEGALAAMGVGPVTIVNAGALAAERGIAVRRSSGPPLPGYETTVGVSLETAERTVRVVGAVVTDQPTGARIVRIDEFSVDVPAEGYVLVLRNRDVPGVIGRVGTALGEETINIASYHQSRRGKSGTEALAAIVVDQAPAPAVLDRLAALPEVSEVRLAALDGTT